MKPRVRILVVDDSELYAESLEAAVQRGTAAEIVGVAENGAVGVAMAAELKPDVISMDVHMPKMDGLEAVAQIMDETPCPIAMVTAATSAEMSHISFTAIGSGALDVLPKPAGAAETDALVRRLCVLSRVQSRRFPRRPRSHASAPAPTHEVAPEAAERAPGREHDGVPSVSTPEGQATGPRKPVQVVGIVISTGGPPILDRLLRLLPADYPAGLVIVQHTSIGFDQQLVDWLSIGAKSELALAHAGARVRPGTVWLAPADQHVRVRMGGRLALAQGDRVDGHRPSGTVLLESLARTYGADAAGLVLTGMGRDGASGLLALREAGGWTGAQDARTSAVDGMPRAAREGGAAQVTVSPSELMAFLDRAVKPVL